MDMHTDSIGSLELRLFPSPAAILEKMECGVMTSYH